MEFHQLKSFVTVAKLGNVTKAAKALNTTPPSVSSHIKLLEDELGVTLFIRTPRGMEITSQGKVLRDKASEILDGADQFLSLASSIHNHLQGHLKFGINANPIFLKIPEIIETVYKQHPQLNLEIISSNTGDILESIQAAHMDCGYVYGNHLHSSFEFVELASPKIAIGVPLKFQKACREATWKEIAKLPWIVPSNTCPFVDRVEQTLKKQNLFLTNTVFSNDDITKLTLIQEGVAVSALEQSEAQTLERENTIFIWSPPEELSCPLSLAFLKQKKSDLLVQTLVQYVTGLWKS